MVAQYPVAGIGIYINNNGRILLGRRQTPPGIDTWACPGGRLEYGESFQECARREALEETGLYITNVRVVGCANSFFKETGHHFVTIFISADYAGGEPQVLEPEKCREWGWFSWDSLPQPLFLTLEQFIEQGLVGK